MVSVDFFTVPTIRFQILYVFLFWRMNAGAWRNIQKLELVKADGETAAQE